MIKIKNKKYEFEIIYRFNKIKYKQNRMKINI